MQTGDPLGYYEALGVLPRANPALIKAAYRVLAMELHPDRNKSPESTAKFQKLQQAYDVLFDPEKRRAYDQAAAQPASAQAARERSSRQEQAKTATQDQSTHGAQAEPMKCGKCGAVSAQPRFRVYWSVASYIFGAAKSPHQGVFCSKCETKVAAWATGKTLLFGWWSVTGFFWTIEAILRNLFAFRSFVVEDMRLLAYQAMCFAMSGRVELGRAVAQEAIALSRSGPAATSAMRLELRKDLQSFLDETQPLTRKTPELKARTGPFDARMRLQLSMLAVLAIGIGAVVLYQERLAEQERIRHAEEERVRLERAGLERARAEAIVRQQEEELRRQLRPLPPTGAVQRFARLRAPYGMNQLPELKVSASPDAHGYLKLSDWQTNTLVMTVFVRAGETAQVDVPPGSYRISIASGQQWYGDAIRFGPKTCYSKVPDTMTSSVVGSRLEGHELTLYKVRDGNLHMQQISASDF